MLEFIRNHVGGLVGLLIIGALSFVFAVSFGQQSQGWGRGAGDDTAITVDGVEISMATLDYAINMNTNRDLSQDSPEYASLRQQVAKGLVERQLLLNMAKKAGISASTEEAQENVIKGEFYITRPISTIATQLGFQTMYSALTPDRVKAILVKDGHRAMLGSFVDPKGKFDVKTFNNVIRYRLNYKEPDFVEEQRKEIVAQRMRMLLLSGIAVPEREIREKYQRENDTVSLSYIKLAPALYAGNMDGDSKALGKWIEENKDKIKQYYETNKFKYTNVEKTARARHILIKVDEDADEAIQNAARAKADALLAEANAGEDFAKLATENSEDPGSATKGGDLGYNPRGVMVPEFDKVMFALKPGEISDVVKTQFGYHIIKLEDIREGTVSLEDATDEIARKLFQENRGKELVSKTADALFAKLKTGADINELLPGNAKDKAIAAPEDTAEDAEVDEEEATEAPTTEAAGATDIKIPAGLNLMVQSTSPFNKTQALIPGIGKSEELVNAAFALTDEKPAGDKVYVVNDNYFIVQLKERKQPTDEDYKTKKVEIESELLASKVLTWTNDRITSVLDKALKDGKIESIVPIPSSLAKKEEKSPAGTATVTPKKTEKSAN
ncbi:MAG: peptidylprolyl isomerase [Deltaproteobacteria bacterium]|nr:peptidylprolyl isomerase [Deltaproteobacteria bacterium]